MHTKFSCLTESGVAPNIIAKKWLLVLVNITVLFEVLSQREFLGTLGAGEFALFDVSGEVAAQ